MHKLQNMQLSQKLIFNLVFFVLNLVMALKYRKALSGITTPLLTCKQARSKFFLFQMGRPKATITKIQKLPKQQLLQFAAITLIESPSKLPLNFSFNWGHPNNRFPTMCCNIRLLLVVNISIQTIHCQEGHLLYHPLTLIKDELVTI